MQVDEFILRIALNASDFTKGATEVKATLEKTKDTVVASGEQIEEAGKRIVKSSKTATDELVKGHERTTKAAKEGTEQLSKMAREALGLFGIFASASGIKSFVSEITTADSAMGRLAANMGVAPEIASAWGLAAERFGGSARATEASITGLYTKLWRMKEFGEEMPQEYWRLAARGGVNLDRTKDAYAQALQLAVAVRNIAATEGRTSAYMWGSSVGFDEGTVNLIIGAGKRLNEVLRETQSIAASARDVKAAQERQTAWEKLSQTLTEVGRKITTNFTQPLVEAAEAVTMLAERLNKAISTEAPNWITNKHPGVMKRFWNWASGHHEEAETGAGTSPEEKWQRMKRVLSGSGINRSDFERELANNPALREKVLAIALGENKNASANQAVIESMMNRAAVNGTSLAFEARRTGEGGYYAGYDPSALGNPALRGMAEENLRRALAGSDVSHGATDNASGAFAAARFGLGGMYAPTFSAGGETFGYPNRSDARGFAQYPAWHSGAGFSAMSSASPSSVSNSSMETNFSGPINITLPGVTDANGFASELPAAMSRAGYAAMFNAGAQ